MTDNRTYRRNQNLRALYAHGASCSCPSCASHSLIRSFSHSLLADGEFDNRFRRIPASMEDDFIRRLHGGKWKRNALDAPMWREYYQRLRQFAEAGYGKALTDPADWREFVLMEQLKRSASTFAGGKLSTIVEELRPLRTLPFKDFQRAAKGTLNRHHKYYLEAEAQTALASANSAARWRDIERRAYLYPNLRYETAGDERVRESHRPLDGVVRAVNDSFWDTYMPPNGWRCRCIVIQTDQPVGGEKGEFEPGKGFRNNPGKTGRLFEEDHPYFDFAKTDRTAIDKASEALRAEWETREVAKIAERYVGTTQKLPGMSRPASVDDAFISRSMSQATDERAIRNDLLTVLHLLGASAKLTSIEKGLYIYSVEVGGFTFTLEVSNDLFYILK